MLLSFAFKVHFDCNYTMQDKWRIVSLCSATVTLLYTQCGVQSRKHMGLASVSFLSIMRLPAVVARLTKLGTLPHAWNHNTE